MQITVSGRVSRSDCRFTPDGRPVVQLELQDAGLTVRATHTYADKSAASGYAARALAASLRGQHIDIALTEVRLRARRLEGIAPVIHPTPSTRKNLAG